MLRNTPLVALFDVDGTLIRTEGPSRHSRAFRGAFEKVFGMECRFLQGMHGMTDMQIFIALAEEMGIDNGRLRPMLDEACQAMLDIYRVAEPSDGHYVELPGVRSLLQTLAHRGVSLGLVTGNAPEIARDKLGSVGLADFFVFGAYGTEAEDRTALPPLAIRRAEEQLGTPIDPERVFVIGDTPRDVACALDNGMRAVAVATGFMPLEQLVASGAELVLPDLADPSPLLQLLSEVDGAAVEAPRR